jgi:3-hydroxyacyl-CoA dehydrogenase/3-hydroxy-2-methylbutyryl-CoA dehydrogenase
MELNDKVVVVTGGASGLGLACGHFLLQSGAKIAVMDVDDAKGEQLVEELGKQVIYCHADVTSEKSVQEAVDKTIEAFGSIHVAINCAGVGTPAKVLGKKGPIKLDVFNRVVQINLVGTLNVIRLTAARMVENIPNADGEKGVVINTASGAAFEGQIGQAAYSASKAGVVGMTLPIAREFADYGIRVVTVAPGLFRTPMLEGLPEKVQTALGKMVPFPKRLGEPWEFARLARDIVENPMMNGETIRLDGAIRLAAK